MAWVKVDDNFPDHPKTLALSLAGQGLWLVGLCYANRQATDGFVPAGVVLRLGDPNADEAAKELVDAGLWHPVERGWQIHQYTDYQRSREQIERVSESRAEAGRRGGQATRKQTGSKPQAKPEHPQANPNQRRREERREENVTPLCSPVDERGADAPPPADDSVRELVREPVVEDEPAAAPTPIRAVPKPKAPLTELPHDWDVSDELWAWAEEKGLPREHVEFENEKFVDYHRGKGTRNKDWPAVWRNWLRNAPQFTRGQGRGAGSSPQAAPTPFRAKGSRVVAAPESPIPDGWWPTEEQSAAARRFGMTAEQVEIQTREFVENARITGMTARDWVLKWESRMRFVAQTGVAQ